MNKTPNTSRESVPQIPMESTVWQPIETAPRDGRDIVGAVLDYVTGEVVGVDIYAWGIFEEPLSPWWVWKFNNGHLDPTEPSHWIPIPSVPSPTEALTTSGVTASQGEKEDLGEKDTQSASGTTGLMEVLQQALEVLLYLPGWPNKTIAELRTQSGDEESVEDHRIERDKRSVIEQMQRHLSEHGFGSPATSVPASPDSSPLPLVSVEEWTKALCDKLCDEAWISYSCRQEYLDKRKILKARFQSSVNASLASLTAEIERKDKLVAVFRKFGCAGSQYTHIDNAERLQAEVASLTSRLEEAERIASMLLESQDEVESLAASIAVAEADREKLHAFIVDQCTDSYCDVHGFVEDSHRCNSFDNMGYQVRLRPEAKELIAMTSKEMDRRVLREQRLFDALNSDRRRSVIQIPPNPFWKG